LNRSGFRIEPETPTFAREAARAVVPCLYRILADQDLIVAINYQAFHNL